jgi:uncharacterized membrane protein
MMCDCNDSSSDINCDCVGYNSNSIITMVFMSTVVLVVVILITFMVMKNHYYDSSDGVDNDYCYGGSVKQ